MNIEQGERVRAQALLGIGSEFADAAMLGDLIRHDLLSCGRRQDLPPTLSFRETDEQRAKLRERFHPVRGQSLYEYAFDVRLYAESGEYKEGTCVVIYDRHGAEK